MDKMIVYEDNVLLVVHKPVGIATETARVGQADLVSELKNYRKRKGEDTYIGVVHRLDQPVEGLLVFAKDGRTAKKLSDELERRVLTKKYAALVAGVPQTPEGELTDYLLKDGRTNLSKVVPRRQKAQRRHRFAGGCCSTVMLSRYWKSSCTLAGIIRSGRRWPMRAFRFWGISNMALRCQRNCQIDLRSTVQHFWRMKSGLCIRIPEEN